MPPALSDPLGEDDLVIKTSLSRTFEDTEIKTITTYSGYIFYDDNIASRWLRKPSSMRRFPSIVFS